MARLTLVLALWMGLVSTISASLTPRKEASSIGTAVQMGKTPQIATRAGAETVELSNTSEFVLTEQTEILLDGKLSKYEQLPAAARIVKMELEADKVTVRKIHFRTRR